MKKLSLNGLNMPKNICIVVNSCDGSIEVWEKLDNSETWEVIAGRRLTSEELFLVNSTGPTRIICTNTLQLMKN